MKTIKLQSIVDKIEIQLKHEKVENKAHQYQINKLQGDLLTTNNEANKGEATQKILVEKKT